MSQVSSNAVEPENAPDQGSSSSAHQDSKDVPELQPFDEDEFDAAFAQLEQPKQS